MRGTRAVGREGGDYDELSTNCPIWAIWLCRNSEAALEFGSGARIDGSACRSRIVLLRSALFLDTPRKRLDRITDLSGV